MQPILPPSEAPPGGGRGGGAEKEQPPPQQQPAHRSRRRERGRAVGRNSRHGESPKRPSRGRMELLLITTLRCGRALRARAAAGSARETPRGGDAEAPVPPDPPLPSPSAWLGEGCSRGSQGRRVGGGGGKGARRLGKQLGSLARTCHWLSRSRGWRKEATRSPPRRRLGYV